MEHFFFLFKSTTGVCCRVRQTICPASVITQQTTLKLTDKLWRYLNYTNACVAFNEDLIFTVNQNILLQGFKSCGILQSYSIIDYYPDCKWLIDALRREYG